MLGANEPRRRPLDGQRQAFADVVMQAVAVERLQSDVLQLPAPRSRLHATAAMEQADTVIQRGFEAAGWSVERQRFTFYNVLGNLDYDPWEPTVYSRLDGANVVASKAGTDPDTAIVVVAHHDTVRDSPGADDNTASVAALLELARLLGTCRFRSSVILAAVDMEEISFFGSKALVARLRERGRVLGAIVFETMAFTSTEPQSQKIAPGMSALYRSQARRLARRRWTGDFTAVIYNGLSVPLATSFAEALSYIAGPDVPVSLRDPNDLPAVGRVLRRLVPAVRHLQRSDHVPFWQAGIPAIQITDTANFRNPHYHEPTDTPDTLDYHRLAEIVGATAVAIGQLAGAT